LALLQLKKAALAVEVLTYRVDHEVAAFGESMRSGWLQFFSTLFNLAGLCFGKKP